MSSSEVGGLLTNDEWMSAASMSIDSVRTHLANIDTCVPFTQGMPIRQFRDDSNGMQTWDFSQSRRNAL